MNTAKLAIKRPIFITCIVAIIMILGIISYQNIGLELMPDVSFPTITVKTTYSGASPEEIEQLVSKPLEDELGTISGIKHLSSENKEGFSLIILAFNMEVDLDLAAQDVRDKVNAAKNNLPDDITDDPVVEKYDVDSQPVIRLSLSSDLPAGELYDLANEIIKPKLEQINDVGNVDIIGGTKREIQVEIDRNKINDYQISMIRIANQINSSGSNVPIGSREQGSKDTIFRAMGEFNNLDQIGNTMISFSGDVGNFATVNTLGRVLDGTEDVTSIGYIYNPQEKNTRSCIYLDIIKQSGKNTVTVTDAVKSRIDDFNTLLKQMKGNSSVKVTSDQSKWIKTNVHETVNAIVIGIILAVLVVFLFLGNLRSTIITGLAIPNSLLGAVIVMDVMGYTFNVMTLMALSLVVGLLVDDAIVVRENIFRKIEEGHDSFTAADEGTTEVMLAVVATTLAILSVFFPIGMLTGVVGKLFKQFGFTVVFAMIVSLFDALTVAPFLSAYFAGDGKKSTNKIIIYFEKFQVKMEEWYSIIMGYSLKHPLVIIGVTLAIFIGSIGLFSFVKQTFIPEGNKGEFAINIEMPAGTSREGTKETIGKIEELLLKEIKDMDYYGVTIGNSNDEKTLGQINVYLRKDRKENTFENKMKVRGLIAKFDYANPTVNDLDTGQRGAPFALIISARDLAAVEKASGMIMNEVRKIPDLTDFNTTMKKGGEEYRIIFDQQKMMSLGVSNSVVGTELRYSVDGVVAGKFRVNGIEYDIRARLKPDQRDLPKTFYNTRVPNIDNKMIPLSAISKGEFATGFSQINRRDKSYEVEITANLAQNGAVGNAMAMTKDIIKKLQLPPDVTYSFSGDSENFSETASSVAFALSLALLFIYLVLSSLYESFITPFTILLAIPFALTGAILALFLTGVMLDIFSMIGMVMLIGIVTKNSILLVDNAMHGVQSGLDRKEAVFQAGQRRLRPILMTSFAMVAGTLPLAMGIGEAAKMRQSMGISIIGGLLLSTLITLIVVPAVFEYVDRFREATEGKILIKRKID